MMTMVGDPVDALSTKLAQVVRTQEGAPNVLQSIGELTQIQGQLAAAIGSLRQDASSATRCSGTRSTSSTVSPIPSSATPGPSVRSPVSANFERCGGP